MMTRKHYRAFAEVFAKLYHPYDGSDIAEDVKYRIACDLCDVFKRDNPNFNRDTFMRACGLED